MSRKLRYVPPGGALVELTTRTVHGRYLLRPGRRLNETIVGIVARAKRRHPSLRLIGAVAMSNHMHMLAWVPDAKVMAGFMCYVNTNIAKEAGKLHNWRQKFWGDRYRSIVVSREEEAQVRRLEYLLARGAAPSPP